MTDDEAAARVRLRLWYANPASWMPKHLLAHTEASLKRWTRENHAYHTLFNLMASLLGTPINSACDVSHNSGVQPFVCKRENNREVPIMP